MVVLLLLCSMRNAACAESRSRGAHSYGVGKAEDWARVRELHSSMQAARIAPDVWTYASLMAACAAGGNRWQEARAFEEEMRGAGLRRGDARRRRARMRVACRHMLPLLGPPPATDPLFGPLKLRCGVIRAWTHSVP